MNDIPYTRPRPFRPVLLLLWTCFLAGLLSLSSGSAAEGFSVKCEKRIMSFHDNILLVTAPESGSLEITVRDEYNVYRRLSAGVSAGMNRITWNGLAYQNERLNSKVYQIDSTLHGDSGSVYAFSFSAYIDYSAQSLIFALPSSEKLFLADIREWFLEAKTVLDGELVMELHSSGGMNYRYSRPVSGGKVLRISFASLAGKSPPIPGEYKARIYEVSNPSYSAAFPLSVREGQTPCMPVETTGEIMPSREAGDAEIWSRMRMPATIVDIGFEEHQPVYRRPDETSGVLGTLHGQTQSVSVYEVSDNWAKIGAWNHEEGARISGWVPVKVLKVVEPEGNYGLLLDKKSQTLTVFENGKRIETLMVSTGRTEPDELYQETAAGSFLTGYHRADFSTNGLKYDFVIQYDGGNLLHQIPYAWGDGKKDFTVGRACLGSKASHACIRIQAEPGTNGLNAYWLWTHIPWRTRLLILDDPDERETEKARIQGLIPEYDEFPLVDSSLDEDDEPYSDQDILLTFGGDVVLGGRESHLSRSDSFSACYEQKGPEYFFSGIRSLLSGDDWTAVNLEGVLKRDSTGEDKEKTWRFRGLPEYAEILRAASVDLVNLANNHTVDYGDAGYRETVRSLADSGIMYCGNGQNRIVSLKGHLIGFGGCRETSYLADPGIIGRDISELRENGAEVIIYQCHWGVEYSTRRSALQEAMARSCVRAGADAVIGHHPHAVQGLDLIDGTPVVYSLGNLCFGGTLQMQTFDAMLLQIRLSFSEGRFQLRFHPIPILTSDSKDQRINSFRPVPAAGQDRVRILRRVQRDTGFAIREWMTAE